jgi:hypothetical protein
MFLQKPVLGDRHSEAVTELHLTVPSVPEDYWRIQMANKVATLVRNANLEGVGWRRGTLIQSKNGRIKDGFMLYNGVEYPAPNGTYQIRHYVGSKAAYVTVGNDLDAALVMLERLNATRAKEAAEITLGIAPAPMLLSKQVKLGLARAFTKFSEREFAEHREGRSGVKLRDVIALVHPKPMNCEQGRVFAKLCNKTFLPTATKFAKFPVARVYRKLAKLNVNNPVPVNSRR